MRKRCNYNTLLLCGLLGIGLSLRLIACYWGYPYQLHADEKTIVENAIDMISKGSYIAEVYNRPDHFEIKCCALLFQVVSYIKYHVSAELAFANHTMTYYLIARTYTVFWGTMTIFLAYKITKKIKPQAKLVAAGLVTFFPYFIQHSAFATPDMVLTFFVLLMAYFTILYLENSTVKYLILMCIAAGIGITIKYTCAISCIWIAIIVCIDCIKRKKYLEIIKYTFLCATLVFFVCLGIAPNLFTNISKTIDTLLFEARSVHLGADGLGFWGNFKFYLTTFFETAGYECTVCFVAGLVFCMKNKNRNTLSLMVGLLFWVCTSVLALHWKRWGIPMYMFFVILSALGISYLYDICDKKKWLKCGINLLSCIILLNSFLSGLLVVQKNLTKEARVDAVQFCEKNGITKENSLYDGYTPMQMNSPHTITVTIDAEGKIHVPSGVEYLIISSCMYERYYAEPSRYQNIVNMYNSIQDNCELIYEAGGNYYEHSDIGAINILKVIQGLHSHDPNTITGYTIKIYRV